MAEIQQSAARREWRDAWQMPFVAMIGYSGAFIYNYTSGVFMPVVSDEFGWSRTMFTSAMLVAMLLPLFMLPAIGMIVDRLGPRRVVLIGIPSYVVGLSVFSLATGSYFQWILLSVMYTFLVVMVSPIAWAAAVASRFSASRGLALAIVLSGSGITATVGPYLANFYIEHFGWRLAYPLLALTWAIPTAPLAWLYFRTSARSGPAPEKPARIPFALYRSSLKSRAFVMLALAACLFGPVSLSINIHLVPILRQSEIPAATAAAVAGLSGIFSIIGRLSAGYLIDRYSPRILGAITFLIPIITVLLLLNADGSVVMAGVAAAIFGLALGAEFDIVSFLLARYFGTQQFGGLYGVMSGLMAVTAGLGPILASWVVDSTNSYDTYLLAIIPTLIIGAVAIALLPKVPPQEAVMCQEATAR